MVEVHPQVSVVVPVFNEADGLRDFHAALLKILRSVELTYEIIYCDDGSRDKSISILQLLAKSHTRLITLSRNFGKEYALTAGISEARGDAVLTIDADGQHPVELIPQFIEKWQAGADVVVGVRDEATSFSSRTFYRLFNRLTGERLIPHSTDFRLLDRKVVDAFLKLEEHNRITRGLIDWVGFARETIIFKAKARTHGDATYSKRQLRKLAIDSFVSLSSVPLFVFGYLGIVITAGSGILGLAVLVEQVFAHDPLGWKFTGTAMLGTLILFLIGIVLMSQGMLALYISHIHTQSKGRPLYVIDRSRSIGADK
jgi:glycosyltransferase involved in cell wall biosynthesis